MFVFANAWPCVCLCRFMCQKVMVVLGRLCFFAMGFRVIVKGKQATNRDAPILAVAPHSSFFDSITCIVAGMPSVVSRTENLLPLMFGRKCLFSMSILWILNKDLCGELRLISTFKPKADINKSYIINAGIRILYPSRFGSSWNVINAL